MRLKMHLFNKICCTFCTLLYVIISSESALGLRDVRVEIPHAVRKGEKAILNCLYDLEGDSLYSVKWYKGRREFYSFTPKEIPAMKVFQFAGVKVDRSSSNESQLVLEAVNAATSGKYSCEVSADAPSFHTLIGAGELEVVVPGKDPVITGIRSRYKVGDIVKGNCTSSHSRPAANITWTVNGYETNPAHVRHFKPHKDPRELETVISAIHFVVTPQHFIYGKLKIRCTAFIHNVYWKSTEKSIEENRLNKAGVSNVVHKFSEDYFDLDEDNVLDRSDTYLTHIKGDVSSLNANGCSALKTCSCFWPHLTTLSLALFLAQQMFQLLQQLLSQTTEAAAGKTKQNTLATTNASKNTKNDTNLYETKADMTALKRKEAQLYTGPSSITKVSTVCCEHKSAREYFQINSITAAHQQQQQLADKLLLQSHIEDTQLSLDESYNYKQPQLQLKLQLECSKPRRKFENNSTTTTAHVAQNTPASFLTPALHINSLPHKRYQMCNKHNKLYAHLCAAPSHSGPNSLNTATCLNTRTTSSPILKDFLLKTATITT